MNATTLRGNRAKGNDGDQQVRAADYLAAIALLVKKEKAARRRLLNSNLMIVDRAASRSIFAPALARIIQLSSNHLLFFINSNVADLLIVRAGAFGSNCKNFTIIGYYVGAGKDCFSGFRTDPVHVVSVDLRVGGCVEYSFRARRLVGLPIIDVHEYDLCRLTLRIDGFGGVLQISPRAFEG
jgi:hypothetical protein